MMNEHHDGITSSSSSSSSSSPTTDDTNNTSDNSKAQQQPASMSSSSSFPATEALRRATSTKGNVFQRNYDSYHDLPSPLELAATCTDKKINNSDNDANNTDTTMTKPRTVFDNIKQVLDESLFPSIQWPKSDDDDDDQNDEHDDEHDDEHVDPLAACGKNRRQNVTVSEDDDERRPTKRRTLLRRARFPNLLSADAVSQRLFDNCIVVPEKYKVLSEYSQPITLTLLFRMFQSTSFAYQWCAAITIGHTMYSMVTDFSSTTTTKKVFATSTSTNSSWAMLDFLSHQVVDSLSLHALITTMLLYPALFGSNTFTLALFLICTQPLHLSIWFKSNFGTGSSHGTDYDQNDDDCETRWIILNTMVAFAVSLMLLLMSSSYISLHQDEEDSGSTLQTVQSICLLAGIVGFNVAPMYTLMHAYIKQTARILKSSL